jgi:hypothetical protein
MKFQDKIARTVLLAVSLVSTVLAGGAADGW